MFVDPMGTKEPWLLTAWRCDHITMPHVNLFPSKMVNLNGYRLRVVASHQPPYVYKRWVAVFNNCIKLWYIYDTSTYGMFQNDWIYLWTRKEENLYRWLQIATIAVGILFAIAISVILYTVCVLGFYEKNLDIL